MEEHKIGKVVNGKERIFFECRIDEEAGISDLLFRGRKDMYPVTYEEIIEALDERNLLEEFVRKITLAAKERGCVVTC